MYASEKIHEHMKVVGSCGNQLGTVDQCLELGDPLRIALDPALDAFVGILAARSVEEVNSKLLEVADQAGGKQPLPIVARHVARDLLLGPVDAQHLAEAGVGSGDGKLVKLLAGPKRGNAEHAVQFIEPYQPVDDLLARA